VAIVIFGWGGGKAVDEGEVAPGICLNCSNNVFFHSVTSRKAFRLYFIPLIPYGGRHFLLCPVCEHGMELHDAELEQAKSIQSRTVAWRRRTVSDEDYLASVGRFWEQEMHGSAARAPATLPGA
jgi:hypothetical protein